MHYKNKHCLGQPLYHSFFTLVMSEMSKASWYIKRHWTWKTCRWCANVKILVQNKKQWSM